MDLDDLRRKLETFADKRDWAQFHSPKNLSMALSVEAAELMEHFQWLTEQQSRELDPDVRQQVAEEIADMQLYLVQLADKLNIDIEAAVAAKLAANDARYPADQVRGSAAKYTQYQPDRKR